MHVRMKVQLPRPSVKHGRDAELGSEPFGVAPEGEQGLARCGKQVTEDERAVA